MIIDLDGDDDAPSNVAAPVAAFEAHSAEVDPSSPYRGVLRYIDLKLDAPVVQLAVPTLLPSASSSDHSSDSDPLPDRIIFATALSDSTVNLHVLPLSPPSPDATPSQWNTQTTTIPTANSHRDLVSALAITFTSNHLSNNNSEERSRSRSRNRSSRIDTGSRDWSLLVASTSTTGTGLLLIHQIPLAAAINASVDPDDIAPIQHHFLRANLSKCTLSFNTDSSSAARHSTLLIGLRDSGCVRLYQVFGDTRSHRDRRGSGATRDSSVSSSKSKRRSGDMQGDFLITLYTDYGCFGPNDSTVRRKRILESAWVLGGRAILTLLETGEWGVWDLEAAGPSSSATTQNLVTGKSNIAGVQGGSITRFAVQGTAVPAGSFISKRTSKDLTAPQSGKLASMTPSSRRKQSDEFFINASSSNDFDQGGRSRGHVCVLREPREHSTSSVDAPDEALLFIFRGHLTYLPSLLAFWKAQSSAQGSLEANTSTRPTLLQSLRYGGQTLHSVDTLPNFGMDDPKPRPDIVVATESFLILSLTPLEPVEEQDLSSAELMAFEGPSVDQHLLEQQQLDISGIDRILGGMTNDTRPFTQSYLSQPAFDHDGEDAEMNLGTPTPKMRIKSSRAKGNFRPGASRGPRASQRIFS